MTKSKTVFFLIICATSVIDTTLNLLDRVLK